ncbi:hypothetical protein ZWY2020_000910 [Hordeum vulgare]|nr:hypothetical protein ZWY2020_000910 [Hordeum vulgare]
MGNPEREVETTRTVKGAFSGATKLGGDPRGYSFKVITSLPPPEEGPNLSFHTLDEQLDLLGKVLSAGDDMIGVEHLEEDSDGKALLKARRSAGLMSAFSGAGGMVYMEYNKGKGAKKKDPAKRHTLFKKRYT